MGIKNWSIRTLETSAYKELETSTKFSTLVCKFLCLRGLDTREKIQNSLFSTSLVDPFDLMDMKKAVKRVNLAIENSENICIFGDYDADGVSSTALVYSYLLSVGAKVSYFIPSREMGYGLNCESLKELAESGTSLILTVDNGISALDEVEYGKSLGLSFVITDHHRPHEKLPDACAVVDPYREDDLTEFKSLAGVGVAFKFVTALMMERESLSAEKAYESSFSRYAFLVSIGTIGDVMPCLSENRVIIKKGIEVVRSTKKPGVLELFNLCGVDNTKSTATDVSYTIIPRINAQGRMSDANEAVELLVTDDKEDGIRLANIVNENNIKRRDVENEILDDILMKINNDNSVCHDKVVIAVGDGFHHGVIGIVAAKITDVLGKPSLIVSVKDGKCKGSSRSIDGFSIFEALQSVERYLITYGGHTKAAGFVLDEKNLEYFKSGIKAYTNTITQMPLPTIAIDFELDIKELNLNLPMQFKKLEPFGEGFLNPVFCTTGLKIKRIIPISHGRHSKFCLGKGKYEIEAIEWGCTSDEFSFELGDLVDIAYEVSVSEYRGEKKLAIRIVDMRLSSLNYNDVYKGFRLYEALLSGSTLEKHEQSYIKPTREQIGQVWKMLVSLKGFCYNPLKLYKKLIYGKGAVKLNYAQFLLSLDVLQDIKLITAKFDKERLVIKLLDSSKKRDLMDSQTYKKLYSEA